MAIRYFILILIACLNSYTSSAQEKQIHSGQLYKLRTKQFVSFDTSSSLIRIGQTGLANIEMIFYRVWINKTKSEVRIVGKACLMDTSEQIGVPIQIFIANRLKSRIIQKKLIGFSTIDFANSNNNGFFDITFKVERLNSIFFYHPQFYLQEFRIVKLISTPR